MYGHNAGHEVPNQLYAERVQIAERERLARRIAREQKAARRLARRAARPRTAFFAPIARPSES